MIRSKNTTGPAVLVSQELKFAFPFGYAYLMAYLLQEKENAVLVFRPERREDYRRFAEKLIAMKPLYVGFGNLYPELYAIREIIAHLDELKRDFPVIIGGQMVTPTPEFAVKITGADIGVIDEGEIILANLTKVLRAGEDPASVAGLVLRSGEDTLNTGPGPFIEDLSTLPPVPYDLFPSETWVPFGRYYLQHPQPHWRYDDRCIPIHGGRGCPYRCNFCYHHGRTRYRSMDAMFEEALMLLKKYNGNMLYFTDDLTIATPKRAEKLVECIRKLPVKVSCRISCRFDILDTLDDALLKEMRDVGVRIMAIGIESASQKILDVMNKKTKVEQIDRGLTRLFKVGMLPTGNVMLGQVDETEQDIAETKRFVIEKMKENKNLQVSFTVATPFPGTEIYNIAMARGLIASHEDFYNRFDRFGQMGKISVNLSTMDDETLQAKLDDLNETYWNIRSKMVGPNVVRVEDWIKKLHVKDISKREGWQRDGVGPFKKWAYGKAYDVTQTALDKLRLRMRGVQ